VEITLNIKMPDNISETDSSKVSRDVLEQVVAESYKAGKLSMKQVRLLLGFSSRFEAEDFIHSRGATGYTVDDLKKEIKTMEDLGLI
jgi:DNA-binding MarR family transcriptional regulator